MQQCVDGVSSPSIYRTVVVGADGSARETRINTAIIGAPLDASTPIANFGSDWYAVLLADNASAATGCGGSTLRAKAGATRSALVAYGQVQPTPGRLELIGYRVDGRTRHLAQLTPGPIEVRGTKGIAKRFAAALVLPDGSTVARP